MLLLRIAVLRQFLDVVYQAIQFPLRIDLFLPSEREAIELFVMAQVAEYGFNSGEASAIACPAFGAVDTMFHFIGIALVTIGPALKEGDLPGFGFLRSAQATVMLLTRYAVALRALVLDRSHTLDDASAAVAI